MSKLHIGLDLDNTLIDYDAVFALVGENIGLLSKGHGFATKEQVKAHLRAGPGGDEDWMRLQGQVYGRHIGKARLYDGADTFLKTARENGVRISIVSHKTRYGHFDPDRVNLWDAATGWLEENDFFTEKGFGLSRKDVYFRETRAEKIAKIDQINCRIFIDDLLAVLNHASFPSGIEKIWFSPMIRQNAGCGLTPHHSWAEIMATVFAHC